MRLYLPSDSPSLRLCQALWDGQSWPDACAAAGVTKPQGRLMLHRLRRRVAREAGRAQVSREYVFRVLFCNRGLFCTRCNARFTLSAPTLDDPVHRSPV